MWMVISSKAKGAVYRNYVKLAILHGSEGK